MTYGVYSKDLHSVVIDRLPSYQCAQKYRYGDCVICTEKNIQLGFRLCLTFIYRREEWRFGLSKWANLFQIGPIKIEWEKMGYVWADKIVNSEEEAK